MKSVQMSTQTRQECVTDTYLTFPLTAEFQGGKVDCVSQTHESSLPLLTFFCHVEDGFFPLKIFCNIPEGERGRDQVVVAHRASVGRSGASPPRDSRAERRRVIAFPGAVSRLTATSALHNSWVLPLELLKVSSAV